jgi:hypothetical protein
VCECHPVEVIFAFRPTFKKEFTLLGHNRHFRRTHVAAGQRLYLKDYADVVMAEDPNKLLG